MKASKIEIALSLAGSVCLVISIFRKPFGLPEVFDWTAPILAIVCFIPLFILQRRRRNARLAAGLPAPEKVPRKRRFWLILFLIVATSLSGPLWLPYTGVVLPRSTLVITSLFSCVFGVLVFVFSRRYWNKKI